MGGLAAFLGIGKLATGLANTGQSHRSSALAAKVSRQNTLDTIKANRQLAQYAYNKDYQMWQEQNRYNAPRAQMGRLEEAGLNPHLVYGTGTVTGNTSGQMPKYNVPESDYSGIKPYEYPKIPDMIGMYQDVQQRSENINLTKQAVEAKQLENDTKEVELGVKKATALDRIGTLSQRHQGAIRDNELKEIKKSLENLKLGTEKERQNVLKEQGENIRTKTKSEKQKMLERAEDIIFKKYKNDWIKMGVTSSDNILFRQLVRAWLGVDFIADEGDQTLLDLFEKGDPNDTVTDAFKKLKR